MVEEIEKLQADAENAIFPMRDLRVFHDCEVGVEVARSTKAVTPLRKSDARAAAGTRRTRQGSRVESSLAARLHKKRSRVRRCCPISIEQHLRRLARKW